VAEVRRTSVFRRGLAAGVTTVGPQIPLDIEAMSRCTMHLEERSDVCEGGEDGLVVGERANEQWAAITNKEML
jgi:hypothetical protein